MVREESARGFKVIEEGFINNEASYNLRRVMMKTQIPPA